MGNRRFISDMDLRAPHALAGGLGFAPKETSSSLTATHQVAWVEIYAHLEGLAGTGKLLVSDRQMTAAGAGLRDYTRRRARIALKHIIAGYRVGSINVRSRRMLLGYAGLGSTRSSVRLKPPTEKVPGQASHLLAFLHYTA